MGKNQANGFHHGNTAITPNGHTSATHTNGKFVTRNLLERAKQYCTTSFDNNFSSELTKPKDKLLRSVEIFENDGSESDALLSGDERCFDVEFTDDDTRSLHIKS